MGLPPAAAAALSDVLRDKDAKAADRLKAVAQVFDGALRFAGQADIRAAPAAVEAAGTSAPDSEGDPHDDPDNDRPDRTSRDTTHTIGAPARTPADSPDPDTASPTGQNSCRPLGGQPS